MKKTLVQPLLDFLFPPLCLSCHKVLTPEYHTLCEECSKALQLLERIDRCDGCFRPKVGCDSCIDCFAKKASLHALGICFEHSYPLQALCSSPNEHVAKALASFLFVQCHELAFPNPDLVVPIPGDWFSQGNDRWPLRQMLAKELSHLFGCTYEEALLYDRTKTPKYFLSLEELSKESDVLIVRGDVEHLRILLVHDKVTFGNALYHAGRALAKTQAKEVWAMALEGYSE